MAFMLVQKFRRWPLWDRGPVARVYMSMFVWEGDVKSVWDIEDWFCFVLKVRVKMGWSWRFLPTGRSSHWDFGGRVMPVVPFATTES